MQQRRNYRPSQARRTKLCAAIVLMLHASALSCVPRKYNQPSEAKILETRNPLWKLNIARSATTAVNDEQLQQIAAVGIRHFEQFIAPVTRDIDVAIGGQTCVRTGYQFEFKKIVFCNNTNTRELGTLSKDVMTHELFHALVCQSKPQLCTPTFLKNSENIVVHEALADFFSWHISPDATFGEDFYIDKPYVRSYRTSQCQSLLEGEHARGNALVSALIEARTGLASIPQFLSEDSFSVEKIADFIGSNDSCLRKDGPQVEIIPEQGPISTLNRYRVRPNGEVRFKIQTNAPLRTRFPSFEIHVNPEPVAFSYTVEKTAQGELFLKFTARADQGWERIGIEFASPQLIGAKSIYLSIKEP